MKTYEIKKLDVLQISKISGIMYFIISLVFVLPMVGFMSLMPEEMDSEFPFWGGAFFVMIPVFYGFIGFIMTAIMCVLYNVLVEYTGGFKMEMEVVDIEPSSYDDKSSNE